MSLTFDITKNDRKSQPGSIVLYINYHFHSFYALVKSESQSYKTHLTPAKHKHSFHNHQLIYKLVRKCIPILSPPWYSIISHKNLPFYAPLTPLLLFFPIIHLHYFILSFSSHFSPSCLQPNKRTLSLPPIYQFSALVTKKAAPKASTTTITTNDEGYHNIIVS